MEGSSNLQICFFFEDLYVFASVFWFGFGGRRLCEPGRPVCNRARAEVSPPTPRRKIGRLLKCGAALHVKSLSIVRPALRRTGTSEDSELRGGIPEGSLGGGNLEGKQPRRRQLRRNGPRISCSCLQLVYFSWVGAGSKSEDS